MPDYNSIFQNCFYVGNNFNAILYGVELVLYFASMKIIRNRWNVKQDRRSNTTFLILSTSLLLMITIYLFAQNFFGQEMWIIHEGYPGGSGQYFADNAAVWYQTFGSASSVVMNVTSDAFLIYRTYVVWADWRVIIFPSILYFATAALGIMTCYFSGRPNADFFVGTATHIALAYSTVGIGMNVTCSTMICARILWVSRRMEATLGRQVSKTYTGAASIIIESMLPYTLFGVAYVGTLGSNSPVAILFLSLYVMFTCVSPQMIILRVLMGRGWTRDWETASTTMRFPGRTGPRASHWTRSGDTIEDTAAVDLTNLSKASQSRSEIDALAYKKV
ncbi:hypothetical protein BD311DRAFT_866088 [Dichomitus squalens]|uniref:Uncharacterized protein n=1 Tax=Dichomitus squalens TaxID=114155 RepID=A0A4Q9MMZ8_9APHY|nr:hypothetical protein BD311DRAFT_866088 [Dichomitus squalens]